MEKEATAHICVVHVSTMTEGKKEMELAFLKALCFHQRGLGAAGCGSVGAMTQASFGQVYRVQVDPGEAVTPAMHDLFCLHLGIKKKEFTRLEKVFKAENPRYNPQSVEFQHFVRKGPAEAPKKALARALANNTLQVRASTAKVVAKSIAANLEVAQDGLHRAEKRCGQQDAIKFTAGTLLNIQSPNKKTKRAVFNGKALKHNGNDKP
jgi:hypothetical protein